MDKGVIAFNEALKVITGRFNLVCANGCPLLSKGVSVYLSLKMQGIETVIVSSSNGINWLAQKHFSERNAKLGSIPIKDSFQSGLIFNGGF